MDRDRWLAIGLLALCVLMLALLSGCATVDKLREDGVNIREMKADDIAAAIEIAEAADDGHGLACWTAIQAALGDSGDLPATVGPVSLYERARVARMRLDAGVPDSVRGPCAVLILDAERAVITWRAMLVRLLH